MRGYRFYEELTAHGKSLGTVLAVLVENRFGSTLDALAATAETPNPPVGRGSVSEAYLRRCRRVPESKARRIHPALFDHLDTAEVA